MLAVLGLILGSPTRVASYSTSPSTGVVGKNVVYVQFMLQSCLYPRESSRWLETRGEPRLDKRNLVQLC